MEKLPMNYHLRNIYSENTVQSFQPHPNLELTPKIPNLLLMIQIQMRGLNKLSEHETSTPLNIFATKATAPTTKNSTKSLKLSNPTTNITRRTPPVTRSQVPKRKETNIEHHPNSTTFDDNLSETPDIQMDDPNDNDPISTTTQVNESINQPIQSNEPPQEEQLVQTLSKSQTSDEQIDYGIFNPPLLQK